jgi:decaprenyl-phosphate phosphoribosyltransferase
MKYFRELEISYFKDAIVFLDIDGTITGDKSKVIGKSERSKVDEIKQTAKEIFLVSNGLPERTKEVAGSLGVSYLTTGHFKPNPKVLNKLHHNGGIVVGDKFMTDGLLSVFTGLPFLKVKNLLHEKEGIVNRGIYFVDNFLYYIFESLRAIRVKQWVKNLLIFAPLFFAGKFFDLSLEYSSLLAFLAFSFSASIVYLINDFLDKENDKLHPKKKWRSIPMGNLGTVDINVLIMILGLLGIFVLFFVPQIIPYLAGYIIFNIIYSAGLKNVPVYDIVSVALMYLFRVVVGGVAAGIIVSPWLLICTFFSALFLITAKRYSEFEHPTRKVLKHYSKEAVSAMLQISAALSVMTYAIYSAIGSTIEGIEYTTVIVTAVFMIILNDIYRGNKIIESPEIYLMKNKKINLLILIWILIVAFLIYKNSAI